MIYNVVNFSVQQCEPYVYVHTHSFAILFHYGLSQDIDCSFLCNEALQTPVNNDCLHGFWRIGAIIAASVTASISC